MAAPLDHVARGYDRVCDPGPHIVCGFWPECSCGEDCADRRDNRLMRRILAALVAAAVAIAAGLIFWGMHS